MTNGNHANAQRQKMVRVQFMLPPDIVEEIGRRADRFPELTRSDVTRALLRFALTADEAAA